MTNRKYDYIVIGAGSAGCVLAARLSEDPNVSVALLEAGDSDIAPELKLPIAFPRLSKTKFDWDYITEPELALNGRRIYLARGKTLGGSSSINALIYIRGNAADFDDWANEGASGWSYQNMLPYFIKSEGNERGDKRYHGHLGPLTVQDGRYRHPLAERFVEAAVQAGHPRNDDFNGSSQVGIGRFQLTQRNGKRWSVADAYLHPVRERPNLHVLSGSLLLRLLFNGRRAAGALVSRYGAEEALQAEREVILSAGSYNSPQALMLSGIGPADYLKDFGIPVLVDLPAGEHLQDHPFVLSQYLTNEKSFWGVGTPDDVALYQKEGRGPLASNMVEAGGFLSINPGSSVPDIELEMAPVMYADEGLSAPHDHAFGIAACLMKPTSRGKVTLRSTRPDAKPRILTNLLTTAEDRHIMIAGVRNVMEIVRQPPLATVRRSDFRAPTSDSESDIWDFVQREAITDRHPTSTCAIGRVVDTELRVFGVEGLRVVDASVMPTVPRGNTNAAVVAIAERAADLIIGH